MINTKMIRDHIKANEYLTEYGKGLKLLNVELVKEVKNSTLGCIAEFEVTTLYKAKKYDNNTAKWIITVYNDGTHQIYFNGETYTAGLI